MTQDFISGVLDAEGVDLNLPEALLRLACYDVAQYTITSQEEEFVQLNYRAKGEEMSKLRVGRKKFRSAVIYKLEGRLVWNVCVCMWCDCVPS